MVTRILFACLLLSSAEARADDQAPRKKRVEWSEQWPRFHVWEYAATAALDAGNVYLFYYSALPERPTWTGDNAFDETIRGWLRAKTPAGRARAAEISDYLTLSRYAVPFGVDLSVALLIHRQLGVTWQLFMIDLEAFAVAGFINNILFYEAGRARPDTPSCTADPSYDPLCGRGTAESFPSGHTLGVATAAGLTCVNHRYLPLYGDDTADAAACVLMSMATVATGVARIMSDRHFTTDVLTGMAIGFTTGYGLPWLLHYRARSDDAAPSGRGAVILPFGGPNEIGVSLVGAL